jgi:hypothetical protein
MKVFAIKFNLKLTPKKIDDSWFVDFVLKDWHQNKHEHALLLFLISLKFNI